MIFSEKMYQWIQRGKHMLHSSKNVIDIALTEGLEKNSPRPGIEPGPPG